MKLKTLTDKVYLRNITPGYFFNLEVINISHTYSQKKKAPCVDLILMDKNGEIVKQRYYKDVFLQDTFSLFRVCGVKFDDVENMPFEKLIGKKFGASIGINEWSIHTTNGIISRRYLCVNKVFIYSDEQILNSLNQYLSLSDYCNNNQINSKQLYFTN